MQPNKRISRWLLAIRAKLFAADPSFAIERNNIGKYVVYYIDGSKKELVRTVDSMEAAEALKERLDAQAVAEKVSDEAW